MKNLGLLIALARRFEFENEEDNFIYPPLDEDEDNDEEDGE